MKRKFLEDLGLEKDIIDKIMKENGSDIETEKANTSALQKKYDEEKETRKKLESEIGELKKTDPAKLQETIDDLQEKLRKRTEADEQAQKDKALADRFSAVSGEKKFVNDFTKNGVLSEFKEALENKDNEGKSDKEIFEGLIKDREGIFSSSNPPADMSGTEPIDSDKTTETLRAAMGLPPEKD